MSDEAAQKRGLAMDRPPCPVCGWQLWLTDIELVDGEAEQHSYLCPLCDHQEVRTAPRWRAAG